MNSEQDATASSIPSIEAESVPTRTPLSTPAARPDGPRLATRWPRFVARMFDLWLEAFMVVAAAALLYPAALPSSTLTLSIVVLPIAMIVDALIYTICGNTPGKAIAGLKVLTMDGRKVRFWSYLRRNLYIWTIGFALGIPIVSLGTMVRSFWADGRGEFQLWDANTSTRSYDLARSPVRVGTTAALLVMGYAALRML